VHPQGEKSIVYWQGRVQVVNLGEGNLYIEDDSGGFRHVQHVRLNSEQGPTKIGAPQEERQFFAI